MIDDDGLLELFAEVTGAVRAALDGLDDWSLTGGIPGQHRCDLAADAAALEVLGRSGLAVLSEESGEHPAGGGLVVVIDPIDGSTNAAHGIPWFATSLCAVDGDGPRVAMVTDQASGTVFRAVRGGGATRNGAPITPSVCERAGDAIVAISGYPAEPLGWRQFRALGAAALDLCLVASGGLDGYVDCSRDAHGPWDYIGGLLVCTEAGATVLEARGRDLAVTGHADRRTPVAGATAELAHELLARRRALDPLP